MRRIWKGETAGSLGATGVIQLGASWSPDGQSILYDSDFRMRLISIDGSNDRVASNDSESGRAQNRRVELTIVPVTKG